MAKKKKAPETDEAVPAPEQEKNAAAAPENDKKEQAADTNQKEDVVFEEPKAKKKSKKRNTRNFKLVLIPREMRGSVNVMRVGVGKKYKFWQKNVEGQEYKEENENVIEVDRHTASLLENRPKFTEVK